MDQLTMTDSAYPDGGAGARVWQLCPDLGGAAHPTGARDLAEAALRAFEVDADFERGGVWAGVADLAEAAYLDLTRKGETALVEEHLPALHSALLAYRDRIRPRYLCLTDTAPADEKTRFYAVDRAYRLVHGLVGMILQWKQEQLRQERWVVIVRNFDRAQNLATRFFVELARRAKDGTIEVFVEAPPNWSSAEVAKLGACRVVARTLPSGDSFGPAASTVADAAEMRALVDQGCSFL